MIGANILMLKKSQNQVQHQTSGNQRSCNQSRCAGVLLHISSLPSSPTNLLAAGVFGTGDFGSTSVRFVDFLAEIGATVWQTLPLNMPHDDGSPYQCLSAHAGNPAFISFQNLVEQNLLNNDDLIFSTDTPQANRNALLAMAYFNYKHCQNAVLQHEFVRFCRENVAWLGDFAVFLVLREKFKHASWSDWPTAYKNKQPAVMAKVKQRFAHEIAITAGCLFL